MLYSFPICFLKRATLYMHVLTHYITKETFMRNFTLVNFIVFSLFQVYNQYFITIYNMLWESRKVSHLRLAYSFTEIVSGSLCPHCGDGGFHAHQWGLEDLKCDLKRWQKRQLKPGLPGGRCHQCVIEWRWGRCLPCIQITLDFSRWFLTGYLIYSFQ